ncbi:MAG: NYN domain-containing protein [Nostoc sp. ChiQUE01a]|nr:NYN domain-containing protein [Nostoc sp. ChiQUE01a]
MADYLNSYQFKPHRKVMLFIDGENLVCRYQAMITQGSVPKQPEIHFHDKDIYIWTPLKNFTEESEYHNEIIRAYYYTSVIGDENKLHNVFESLKKIQIVAAKPQTLYPVIFKKARKEIKAKGVDIQMTVDILSHVYQNNVDTVCLLSGDGDYLPVIKEIISKGKRILIGAFSNGLHSSLIQLADAVINLDTVFFN